MHFEIVHDLDVAPDAAELAVVSPRLVRELGTRVDRLATIEQTSHAFRDGQLERAWDYRAHLPVPAFAARYIRPEMFAWTETTEYATETHRGTWTIVPSHDPSWTRYCSAKGTYELAPRNDGGTRRVIRGELALDVPVGIRGVAERMIVREVQRIFAAEADALREIATLA